MSMKAQKDRLHHFGQGVDFVTLIVAEIVNVTADMAIVEDMVTEDMIVEDMVIVEDIMTDIDLDATSMTAVGATMTGEGMTEEMTEETTDETEIGTGTEIEIGKGTVAIEIGTGPENVRKIGLTEGTGTTEILIVRGKGADLKKEVNHKYTFVCTVPYLFGINVNINHQLHN